MPKDIQLTDCFLHHSYPPSLAPFRTVMDLPRERAVEMVEAFGSKISDRDADPATYRGTYYDHRREVEDWLRLSAKEAGAEMRAANPIYFRLVRDPENETDPEAKQHGISLSLKKLDPACCTFTIGDSFCNYRHVETAGSDAYGLTPHDALGRVFSLKSAEIALSALKVMEERPAEYIEVQMWDRPNPS